MLGLGAPGTEREGELADAPIFGDLFRSGGQLGARSKIVNELYDTLAEAELRQHSLLNPETPVERRLRLQLTDATRAVSILYHIRSATPGRTEREEINQQIREIANDAMGLHQEGVVRRGPARTARKRAERLEKQLERQQQRERAR